MKPVHKMYPVGSSRLFGVCFTADQNRALAADEKAPRLDLNPPQREEYRNDVEYAFGLRDYANRLIAANKGNAVPHGRDEKVS